MRVALIHDDLIQWGGAERVLVGLSEIFPEAPIFTSLFDQENQDIKQNFKGKQIITSFLQKIPWSNKLYKTLFPFYPIAFEQFDFSKFDLVISQSTRFAKSIITKPPTKHICYCHTPPRFLWDLSFGSYPLLNTYLSYLRVYDRISSTRADYFLAGSENARERIKKFYKTDCPVVYPFVDMDRFAGVESFTGGYFLVISRLNKYKRIDLAIKASAELNFPLKIIGKGPQQDVLEALAGKLGANIEFLGNLPDNLVNEVLAGAKALIICGKEDFGLTSLEAQALGKPVVAYGEGGALETVIEGKTGFFFENQNVDSLTEVLKSKDFSMINPEVCRNNAQKFSKEKFITSFKTKIDFLLN